MLSKIKKLNWGRIITLVVVFFVCLFMPLLCIQLVLKDIKTTNDIHKLLLVLLGSRSIIIITTRFVEYFKTFDNPRKDIRNIYVSSLISYIVVFSYMLINTSDFSYITVILLIVFDFFSEYMSLTAFDNKGLKKFLSEFIKDSNNYVFIAISFIILRLILKELMS